MAEPKNPRPGLSAHGAALSALRQLHNVCKRMESERDSDKPTEDEYQAAMSGAADVLGWPVLEGGAA